MKNEEVVYVYAGGSHMESAFWRQEFQSAADHLTLGTNFYLRVVDPMARNINERDHSLLVGRDVSIIHNRLLKYIVLSSKELGAVLSTGATCEMMLGVFLDKPVIVVGESQENKCYPSSGTRFREWHHPFVKIFSEAIVETIDEAILWIIEDLRQPKPRPSFKEKMEALTGYAFPQPDINPFA